MGKFSVISSPEQTHEKERNSVGFFVDIRNRMFDSIGIPEAEKFKADCYALASALAYRNKINNNIQSQENLTTPVRLKEKAKQLLGYKKDTPDFEEMKRKINSELESYEKYKPSFDILKEVEYSPAVKRILQEYGKETISQLFDDDYIIDENRFMRIEPVMVLASESFVYRNRKITQIVADRYARVAPLDIGVENFIQNAHTILGVDYPGRYGQDPIQIKGYRRVDMDSDKGFFAPLSHEMVASAVTELESYLRNVEKTDDGLTKQKEALKAFCLFEIIHPFIDGNGRTGRALFVYLQRYFSKNQKTGNVPVHIPIARYESPETINIPDGKKPGHPGSISFEVGDLVHDILSDQEMITLFEEQKEYFPQDVGLLVKNVISLLGSEKNNVLLDKLLGVIKTQSAVDDIKSEDLNLVYETMKEALKDK